MIAFSFVLKIMLMLINKSNKTLCLIFWYFPLGLGHFMHWKPVTNQPNKLTPNCLGTHPRAGIETRPHYCYLVISEAQRCDSFGENRWMRDLKSDFSFFLFLVWHEVRDLHDLCGQKEKKTMFLWKEKQRNTKECHQSRGRGWWGEGRRRGRQNNDYFTIAHKKEDI